MVELNKRLKMALLDLVYPLLLIDAIVVIMGFFMPLAVELYVGLVIITAILLVASLPGLIRS